MQPRREYGHWLDDVRGELLLELGVDHVVKDDDPDTVNAAQREDEIGAKPQQTILVRQNQTIYLPPADHREQALQAALAVIEPRAEVLDDLDIRPAGCRAVKRQAVGLTRQIGPLVM